MVYFRVQYSLEQKETILSLKPALFLFSYRFFFQKVLHIYVQPHKSRCLLLSYSQQQQCVHYRV